MDKSKLLGLVTGTPWNGMLELNRMAFTDALPRNSESRAMAVAFRLLRKHAPHVQWIVSFSDGTQCGDGTIYRAAGFVLTQVHENKTIMEMPNGEKYATIALRPGMAARKRVYKMLNIPEDGTCSRTILYQRGAKLLPGWQMRYIYFLDPTARERLTVPVLPFSTIDKMGARMYRGTRAGSIDADAPAHQAGEGGPLPTSALQ